MRFESCLEFGPSHDMSQKRKYGRRIRTHSWSKEELPVCGREGWIIREFPGQSAHDRRTSVMSQVEEGVHVWQELISDVHRCLAGIDDRCPDICLLRIGGQCIVIPVR